MTYANKTLKQQYRVKAHYIGSNAIKLVDDFFNGNLRDRVGGFRSFDWKLTDLDRALNEMSKSKVIGKNINKRTSIK